MKEEQYVKSWNSFSITFFKTGIKYILIHIVRLWFIPPHFRPILLRLCGHRFKDSKNVFIGADVLFDKAKGARTFVGANVTISTGVRILNHFVQPGENNQKYSIGNVIIEDGVFLGMNVLIVKPVRIGKNSLIAAGSVVTKDIPDGVIASGCPAKVMRKND